jgi:hypothetical protein
LILVVGRHWNETDCSRWGSLHRARLAVNFPGAEHIAVSDAVWALKHEVKSGTTPEVMIAATRDYVAAFLDANLRAQTPQPLLSGSNPAAGAVVADGSQSLCSE